MFLSAKVTKCSGWTYNTASARTGTRPRVLKDSVPEYASYSAVPTTSARSARPMRRNFRLSTDADVSSAVASTLGMCRLMTLASPPP
jgi:hypothetical protein